MLRVSVGTALCHQCEIRNPFSIGFVKVVFMTQFAFLMPSPRTNC